MRTVKKEEPDFRKYIDQATGLRCMIVPVPEMGHLCGYVQLPPGPLRRRLMRYKGIPTPTMNTLMRAMQPGYPRHGARYEGRRAYSQSQIKRMDVHGGVTFLDRFTWPGMEGLWIGFDCGHLGDASPGMEKIGISQHGVYRDHTFVEHELAKLAKQVARLL